MTATVPLSPARKGKQHLLTSCAIAAGIAALAYGGPALAQVAGTGTFASGTGSITNNGLGNSTTVNVDGAQSIINWVPTDSAATGGAIDFLPVGENWNFNGSGDYTVLNRFVDSGSGALSRQIALNGTVNSTDIFTSGGRGGNIWFYNAGGILIGATGVVNVGSLVLTTNDIITTGGLFGPGGTIRFNGAAGSTSAVTVNGAINANKAFNAGNAYVALVAPRVVQAGAVRVDGSVAYVAAEQAEIRINGGLFDINVTTGAEGGNAITHTGTTTGPAHQQGDTDQSRIYMVAIPKNDAVTMLVSGQIGYDDALSAQIEPDGAVRLSAGYNITGGELNAAPVNATAANITVNDTLFRSDTIARASGAFVGEALQPTSPSFPNQGRIFVEGNGTFIGDASATINIGANQAAGATGDLTLRSGTAGSVGVPTINVTGGELTVGGALAINADGVVDAVTGAANGGNAGLVVGNGGVATVTGNISVTANGIAGFNAAGNGGVGTGGNALVQVTGVGSTLSGATITVNASGVGGGVTPNAGPVADIGGNGRGGSARVNLEDGGSLTATTGLIASAIGTGQTGTIQSGNGQGGSADITVSGPGMNLQTPQTIVSAGAVGGGNLFDPMVGTIETLAGGDAQGGVASIVVIADEISTINFGDTTLNLSGVGGAASGENAVSGDGLSGNFGITANGGGTVQFTTLTGNASGTSGAASSPSGLTATTGDARGGSTNFAIAGGSTFVVAGDAVFDVSGTAAIGDNMGSGIGGSVRVAAVENSNINIADTLSINAFGGSAGFAVVAQSVGSATGGRADIIAESGAIRADGYQINASAGVVNTTGTGGVAQGGRISFLSSAAGQILVQNDTNQFLDVSAATGVSAGGSSATGGAIELIANGGTIDFALGATVSASGVSGGAITPGVNSPTGTGGSILIRVAADPLDSSAISLGDFEASSDGRTENITEGSPDIPRETTGTGQGGTTRFDIQGGTFDALTVNVSANGVGGAATGSTGTGGTAFFTQTGGVINITDMAISADGAGSVAPGQSGSGIGGTATIDLLGGTITAADITASAAGIGADGSFGNDQDPLNILPGGIGGIGLGGTATINIDGTAVVNAGAIQASALGTGGGGGDFFNFSSFGGTPGTPGGGGEGIGGTATVNVRGGTTTTVDMIADASGIGGDGGNSFFSSSSGGATGVGTGGTGGAGRGGTATIALESAVAVSNLISSLSQGTGGDGGSHNVGGNGGNGFGGLTQAIVTGFDVGDLTVVLDSSAQGGTGANANDGNGGVGGNAVGGTARARADGAGGSVAITNGNFITDGVGGNGGTGRVGFGSSPTTAPTAGNGGSGTGGTIEAVASNGGNLVINAATPAGVAALVSQGRGGDGAAGTGFFGGTGGNGGNGGAGVGGSINLIANGGTIALDGDALSATVNGVSGDGGLGADGSGGPGANGTTSPSTGGTILFEASNGLASAGQIQLGTTSIDASGDAAGRVVFRGNGSIEMTALNVLVTGAAAPTNNDVDTAAAGIFFAPVSGGTITTTGDMDLTTDSSVGVYAQSGGGVAVGGTLTIQAADQVDIRHGGREGEASTIQTVGDLSITAGTSINGAAGSLLAAGGTLSLTADGPTASIGVDRLDGANIVLTSSGAAGVEHAEAANDFTANAASFRTGLNSIITGGDIAITSPGAVDLGNSTAGGFVQVQGQTIAFNNIVAGTNVGLTAIGNVAGAEGINGGSIDAGGDINLSANSIALTGTATGNGSFFAFGNGGAVLVNNADVDGSIAIFSGTDLNGIYVAGGNIFLNSTGSITASAQANGGYVDGNGVVADGNLFVAAGGDVTLTDSSAARMFGVSAGQAASIVGGSAGEDLLMLAGTTANLANFTAGDDITVQSGEGISVQNVATTGAGADTANLGTFTSASVSFVINTAAPNGANIVLTSSDAGIVGGGTINANGDLTATAATEITQGSFVAGTDLAMTAGAAIDIVGATGGGVALDGATGIAADAVTSQGLTSLTANGGAIAIDNLSSVGAVSASADSILVSNGGPLQFATLTTDVGNATISTAGALTVANGTVAGTADLRSTGGALTVNTLTAASATLNAAGPMALGGVAATGNVNANAQTSLSVTGVVNGTNIALASADIILGSAAQVGTAGVTQQLSITNNNNDNQTFIGGTGTRSGYHLDAAELTRLYGTQIGIVGPEVQAAGGGSVGSAAPPDVIVDSFTMTGGGSGSNLGANGALTISTPGKLRVIGNVALTGLTDANTLNLVADDALEVILGQGTVRLVNGTAPAGQLNLVSDDVIVATQAAIAAVGAATTTNAITTRLGENDGVVLDEGALFARGIRANVSGGFYVQNSGASTELGQRRGLTFGAGGLSVQTQGPSRVVLNGVQFGANGQVTGLDVIPLFTVAPQSNGVPGTIDPRSTINGCLISNPLTCTTVVLDFESNFPVQDIIEEETESDDATEGSSLPVPLITMRDIDALTGEPLLDDPVTGSGNDDLWTAPTE